MALSDDWLNEAYETSSRANEVFHDEWISAAEQNGMLSRHDAPAMEVRRLGQTHKTRVVRGRAVTTISGGQPHFSCKYPKRPTDTVILATAGPTLKDHVDELRKIKETPIWVANRFFEHAPGFDTFDTCVVSDVHSAPLKDYGLSKNGTLLSGLYTNPEFSRQWLGKRYW